MNTTIPAPDLDQQPLLRDRCSEAIGEATSRDWRCREIARTLRILHAGKPFEVRILKIPGRGKPHSAAGYFSNVEETAKVIANFDIHRRPGASYVVMNMINPALAARSPGKLTEFPEATASDHDILARRWILVDLDPARPAGISSCNSELNEARRRSDDLFDYLREMGFAEPVVADSGNGRHLLTRIDLPNDTASKQTVEKLLKVLDREFGAKANRYAGRIPVAVDLTVFNAARITKLYGTMTRKGHSTPERPHRLSRLVYVPDFLESGL